MVRHGTIRFTRRGSQVRVLYRPPRLNQSRYRGRIGLPEEPDDGEDNNPTRLPYYAWRVREIQRDIVIPSNRFQT